ncbi:Ff.00g086180.m01.CDS01 [Fusarium sp. VM40]|nr:Ff.00g086180.m01.CDS01 [Fusarium sp. VM40]
MAQKRPWRDPAANYISTRPGEHNFSSESSFNQAIKWLDDCIKSHTGCHPNPKITPMMPSRLIDVSITEAGGRVRIVDTEGVQTRYAALKYCRGQITEDQKLQLSNHTAWTSQGVFLDQLSRTIHDAVTVARGLKLSYLWVDTLCIIQDYDKDKEKELKHMHSVYENSFVIISVIARDGSEGFLDMQHGPITTIPYPLPNGQIGIRELEIVLFFNPDLSKIELRAGML